MSGNTQSPATPISDECSYLTEGSNSILSINDYYPSKNRQSYPTIDGTHHGNLCEPYSSTLRASLTESSVNRSNLVPDCRAAATQSH